MKELYRKLFLAGDWQMAYRINANHWPFNYDIPFIPLPNNSKYWYADPLLFETEGKIYLFCEAFNNKEQKGELAVMEWRGDTWSAPKVIISQNYHMSYPCVFKHKEKYYMIPESAECGSLELYVADSFPFCWRKEYDLLPGANLADPTVFELNGLHYLYVWDETNGSFVGRVFLINLEERQCKEVYNHQFVNNSGRPAGTFFRSGEKVLRPSQDSVGMYGKGINWIGVQFDGDSISERLDSKLEVNRVTISGVKGEKRIHTFSTCSKIEIIDYCEFKFDLFKRFKIIKRKRMLAQRNKINK
jgi:hypothetical protein